MIPTPAQAAAPARPESAHFTLQAVAEGVWAALARLDGGAAVGNTAIVDLGDRTLVFDTCWTPTAARDLRAAAETLTGRPVTYTINSHRHGDHVLGNPVFADTTLIATERTREGIAANVPQTVAAIKANGATQIRALEAQIAQETDPARRTEAEQDLRQFRTMAADLPTLEVVLPPLVFDRQLTFHGSRRTAKLLTFGGGHTESDAFLYLPDDRIVIMADLLTVGTHPWLGHGDPEEWLRILERVTVLDIATAVPGHGPVGAAADFAPIQTYLRLVMERVAQARRSGQSAEEVAQPVPAPFDGWLNADGFVRNIQALLERAA